MSCPIDLSNYGRFMDLKRNRTWKQIKWTENDPIRQIVSENYHWGQLKLYYSELEFICIVANKYDLNKCVIVYVGAAAGNHIEHLEKLFPELHWLLIDPATFAIKTSDKIDIWTGNKGFFKDESIPDVFDHPFVKKSDYILFISDIRTETTEDTIHREMINQQRWLVKLKAQMGMLKFRLPYTIPGGRTEWVYDTSDLKGYIKQLRGKKNTPHKMYYLDGQIFTQLFPPQYSTEMRLIVEKNPDGLFHMKNYDTVDYEEKCLYYNVKIRQSHVTYKDSELLTKHILGCRSTYEIASEYFIVKSYLDYRRVTSDFNAVCEKIYEIRNFHSVNMQVVIGGLKFSKSLAMIQMYTIYSEKFLDMNKLETFIRKKKIDSSGIKNLFNSITNLYNNIQEFIKNQQNYLTDSRDTNPVLSNKQYNSQIQLLNNGSYVNTIIYNKLTEMFDRVCIQNPI